MFTTKPVLSCFTMTFLVTLCLLFFSTNSQFTNPGCVNFTTGNLCLLCQDRYYLSGGICFPVSPLCLTYNKTNGNCLSCFSGFMMSGNTCVLIPVIEHCLTYTNTGVCSQCASRYYVFNNNSCQPVSASCDNYTADGNCTSCVQNYTIFGGICFPLIENCLNQSATACLSCNTGYILNVGVCVKEIPNCLKYSGGHCSQCENQYILFELSCYPVIDNCTGYNTTTAECVQCEKYFSLFQGYCVPKLDQFCSVFNGTGCLQCSQGYYFNSDGRCMQVNPLCKSHNVKGECLTCFNGYSVINASCIPTPQAMDPYCSLFNGTKCLQCSFGYRFNASGLCVAQDYLCKLYHPITFECLLCYPGFMVGGEGKCGLITEPGCLSWFNLSCQACSNGYYLSQGHCHQIDPLCSRFNYTSLKCSACYFGYVLIQQKCELVTQSNPLSNCAKIGVNYECLSCYWGFYLSGGQCRVVDPLCKTFDNSSGACTSCYGGYFLFRRQGKCIAIN